MDTRKRTLTKAFFWQVLGLVVMTLIGWALTGSATLGGGLALSNAIIGFVTYFFYERIWTRIGWGRVI